MCFQKRIDVFIFPSQFLSHSDNNVKIKIRETRNLFCAQIHKRLLNNIRLLRQSWCSVGRRLRDCKFFYPNVIMKHKTHFLFFEAAAVRRRRAERGREKLKKIQRFHNQSSFRSTGNANFRGSQQKWQAAIEECANLLALRFDKTIQRRAPIFCRRLQCPSSSKHNFIKQMF